MEISLEKIELVKDRTGVNYKEAKDALIKAEGSVVDAIIMIEDEIDIWPKSKAGDQASHLVENLKQLIKKGNVSKIVVKKDDETILNIPVNLGIVGAVWAFWPTIVATIIALGMKCSIELIKDNGEVVSISDKASETFGDVKENCSVIADDIKGKSGDAFTQMKDKAANVINKTKSAADDVEEEESDDISGELSYDDDYFNFDDFEDIIEDESDDDIEILTDSSDYEDEEQDTDSDDVADELRKAGEKFEDTIAEYKKKNGRFKFLD
jgi:hypothetical protein